MKKKNYSLKRYAVIRQEDSLLQGLGDTFGHHGHSEHTLPMVSLCPCSWGALPAFKLTFSRSLWGAQSLQVGSGEVSPLRPY